MSTIGSNNVETLKAAKDVQGLLNLIKSENLDPDLAVSVCNALREMFTKGACKGRFERMNGCSCLVALVSPVHPPEVVAATCNAISVICDDDSSHHFKKQFGEVNGPKRLVDMLKSTMEPAVIEAVCKAIKSTYTYISIHEKGNSFSDFNFNINQFDEAGLIERLANLINLSLSTDIAYMVCSAITKSCELQNKEANKSLFGKSGGIIGLINIMKTQGLPFLLAFEVCRATGFVLSNHEVNQNLFHDAGGCEALTSHIGSWFEADSEISEFGSSAIKAAAENNIQNQTKFRNNGAIGMLNSIKLKYTASIRREANNALRALGEIVPVERSCSMS